jgi:hypothetical protein
MQTKPKANSVITHEIVGGEITFTVRDAGAVTLNVAKLSDRVRDRAMLHGMIQRISDAAALSRDPATGIPATPADKLASMRALVDHYETGTEEWNRRRAGGDGGVLVRALMELYPTKTREQIGEFLAGKSAREKDALKRSAKVAPIIERMERDAGRGLDGNAMLEGLEG